MRKFFPLLLLICMVIPVFAGAQSGIGDIGGQEIKILLDPKYPEPDEEFEARISGDVYGSTLVWYVNGKEIETEQNLRSVDLIAGAAGETQTITVAIVSPKLGSFQISKSVTPLYLDLIIEPQTHVPSFYLGRPMVSVESLVNTTAILSGDSIYNNSNLVYEWQVGNEVIGGGPLRGQNKVSFSAGRTGSTLLTLSVSDLGGEVLTKRSVFIPVIKPSLLFYESHSLLGLSNIPVDDTFNMVGQTATLRAEPYFLDSRVFNDPDILEWKINNQDFSNSNNNPYEVTVEKGGATGKTRLDFRVQDTTEFLQGVEDSIYINID